MPGCRRKGGELVFPTDFRGTGTEDAIKKALSRLAKKGMLKRLAHGEVYRQDYNQMQEQMIYGNVIPFDELINQLKVLQEEFRKMKSL